MSHRRVPAAYRRESTCIEPTDFRELSKEADDKVRRFFEEYEAEREEARRRTIERRTADERRRLPAEAPV